MAYRVGFSLARNQTKGITTSASNANINNPQVIKSTLKFKTVAISVLTESINTKKISVETVSDVKAVD